MSAAALLAVAPEAPGTGRGSSQRAQRHIDRDETADLSARFRALADGFDHALINQDDDVREELLRGVYLAARKALVVLR